MGQQHVHPRWDLQMKGADILQLVSAQPQEPEYAWLALATAQFSLPVAAFALALKPAPRAPAGKQPLLHNLVPARPRALARRQARHTQWPSGGKPAPSSRRLGCPPTSEVVGLVQAARPAPVHVVALAGRPQALIQPAAPD
jgi:hypothetical protein